MKISIIGTGKVGSTLAYTLLMRELCDDLALVNRTVQIAKGDAHDLQHAQSFIRRRVNVHAGNIEESKNSELVIVTVSVPMPTDMSSRNVLADGNLELFRDLIPRLVKNSPDALFLIVTNPVDVMTFFTIEFGDLDPRKVLGIGTIIDSARFRTILSENIGIHPDDLRAYILGEHGDSQFPVMSHAFAGADRIDDTPERRQFFEDARQAGHKVFHEKGYTNYAISMATALVVEAIALNSKRTMPISTLLNDFYGVSDVCLSVPVVVGAAGIEQVLEPEFSGEEVMALQASAKKVKGMIEKYL